jgi:hypothetical protein
MIKKTKIQRLKDKLKGFEINIQYKHALSLRFLKYISLKKVYWDKNVNND